MKRGLLAALCAVSLLATACSGPVPGEAIANAASAAEKQGSMKVFMEISNSLPTGDFEMTGEGAFDLNAQHGQMTLEPSASSASAPAAALGAIEMVFTTEALYMRTDAFKQFFPEGKEWMKIDLQAAAQQSGVDLEQLRQLGQGDPSQQLDYLEAADEVEEVGSEEVRGVETTHYIATIDLNKVAEQNPEAAESIRKAQGATGIDKVPAHVWVDAEGLPRRMSMKMGLGTGGDESSSTTVLMEMFDYGTDVVIDVPPDRLTLDPSQLQG